MEHARVWVVNSDTDTCTVRCRYADLDHLPGCEAGTLNGDPEHCGAGGGSSPAYKNCSAADVKPLNTIATGCSGGVCKFACAPRCVMLFCMEHTAHPAAISYHMLPDGTCAHWI